MFHMGQIEGKKVLRSDMLKGLTHLFTTRESFIKTKDENLKNTAIDNTKDICKYLNIKPESIVSAGQTHGINIREVSINQRVYPDTDAFILTNTIQSAVLNFADCTPVILYDKLENIAALMHCGWRGTALGLAKKTVQKLVDEYEIVPENLCAAIGPCICHNCFEIREDTYKELVKSTDDTKGLYIFSNNKIYADLKEINKRQLNECGVTKIDVCHFSTCCDNDLFFSYRKENGTTNRISALIKLNP